MKIMSFNLQNNHAFPNSSKYWLNRIPLIIKIIQQENPDIVATQEMSLKMKEELEKKLKTYRFCSKERYRSFYYEDLANTILVKKDILILDEQIYSLGPTKKTGSKYFFETMPRTCHKIVFSKDNFTYTLYNTHLDHMFPFIRHKELNNLKEIINEEKNPFFLLGDFNMPICDFLLEFKINLNLKACYFEVTERKFKRNLDHIFLSQHLYIQESGVIKTKELAKASDHYCIFTTCKICKE